MSIAENIARVRERCASAAERAGRSSQEITLLAVTKTVSPEYILSARESGITHFGENYVQEAKSKVGIPPLNKPDISWHLIGHLQSNKVREVVGKFAVIQSVDSLALAQEISKRAVALGIVQQLLLEVKLDANPAKFGFGVDDLPSAVERIGSLEGIQIRGLMGMAPFTPSEVVVRSAFQTLYQLFEHLPHPMRYTLSMGMTGDFEIAIEEGATLVRIGTAIFGSRSQANSSLLG